MKQVTIVLTGSIVDLVHAMEALVENEDVNLVNADFTDLDTTDDVELPDLKSMVKPPPINLVQSAVDCDDVQQIGVSVISPDRE